jgi:ribosome recycling factor
MIDEVLLAASTRMEKTMEALRKELTTIRTGRATPALIENIKVDYYGTPTPLKQIATISAPQARLLVIQPWDSSTLSSIKKAILKSELGLNPTSDKNTIHLPIPQLSEERRKELVRAVHKRAEDGRIALRNVRRDALEELRKLEREKEISQDEQKRGQEQLQELTDSFIATAGKVADDKEAELLEV